MKLRRRDWPPTRGWMFEFRNLILWERMRSFPFADRRKSKRPEVIAVAEPVVVVPTRLRKPQKVTNQMGFGF